MLGWEGESQLLCPGVYLRSELWGSPAKRPIPHFFFFNWCGLHVCLCSLLGLWRKAGHGKDVQIYGCVAEWALEGQSPMHGRGWSTAWRKGLSLACRLVKTVALLIQTIDPITIRGKRLMLL